MGCKGSKPAAAAPAENVKADETNKTLLDSTPARTGQGAANKTGVKVPLKVTIVSAKNLRNADCVLAGKSDPYCTCEVTDKPDSRVTTNTVDNQLNPEWNHECAQIESYCVGDSLTFVVKDKDPIKPDDILGKFVLTTDRFFPNGCEEEVKLLRTGDNNEALLRFKVAVIHPKVQVSIISASNLRNADWVGRSDPYCVCEVEGKPDTKIQTPNVDENLNPQWNHSAEMVGFHAGDALIFTVKDKDPLKPDDVLGKISLPYETFAGAGFEGDLKLEGCAVEVASQLTIKVTVNAVAPAADALEATAPVAEAAEAAAGAQDASDKANEIVEAESKPEENAVDTIQEKIVEESPAISQENATDIVVEEHASAAKTCFC